MPNPQSSLPRLFKAIALFTPGGDLVYTIDSNKQDRWHIHLCLCLQEVFGLPEPPYFLLPGYTATVDRWLNPRTGKIETSAEIYPAVKRYLPLLEILFETQTAWHLASWQEEHCNPAILETYRPQFSALWSEKNLIIKLDSQNFQFRVVGEGNTKLARYTALSSDLDSYVLKLFIAGNNENIKQTLDSIHRVLEKGLNKSYTLKIIDILKNPEQAEIYHISATPTLIRISPKPIKTIVGDLEDSQKILRIISS